MQVCVSKVGVGYIHVCVLVNDTLLCLLRVELYMVQDKSDDFQDTWKFLKNRIDETELVGKAIGDVCV